MAAEDHSCYSDILSDNILIFILISDLHLIIFLIIVLITIRMISLPLKTMLRSSVPHEKSSQDSESCGKAIAIKSNWSEALLIQKALTQEAKTNLATAFRPAKIGMYIFKHEHESLTLRAFSNTFKPHGLLLPGRMKLQVSQESEFVEPFDHLLQKMQCAYRTTLAAKLPTVSYSWRVVPLVLAWTSPHQTPSPEP